MKKFLCVLLLICTITLCLSSCQKCEICNGNKKIECTECLGHGKEVCDSCDGKGDCTNSECWNGRVSEGEDCTYCESGWIINPITWQQFTCGYCNGQGFEIVEKECWLCDGSGKCFSCDGSGLKEDAKTCTRCEGIGEIDCSKCAK